MEVKHADRDNLRTLTAMIDTPVQRAESAFGACYASVTFPGVVTRRCGVHEPAGGGARRAVGVAQALLAAQEPRRVACPRPHRIPTSPGPRRGSPQNPHGQNGIPRHTTARMLICPYHP